MLAKLARENTGNWNLYLTQALAAVRFTINETSRFSPYFLLFGRDVALPVDNLLKPRRRYMGEDHHQLLLEQQHKIFVQARRRIKRAQKRKNDRINAERKVVEFKVGDPVYYKIQQREGKLGTVLPDSRADGSSIICNMGSSGRTSKEGPCQRSKEG